MDTPGWGDDAVAVLPAVWAGDGPVEEPAVRGCRLLHWSDLL